MVCTWPSKMEGLKNGTVNIFSLYEQRWIFEINESMEKRRNDVLDGKQNKKYGPREENFMESRGRKKKWSTSIASKHLANKIVDVQHTNSRMTTSSDFNQEELTCYSQVA